ncbi:2-dehydropantoate 2-reductase [Lentisphaerota bacterium WC36G]|nr:2-dehydropantoate 2-reductase [Lentisphaerae bacterium WC36]
MSKKKNIVLYGAGAVGVYFVGRMSFCNSYKINFITRTEYSHVKEFGYNYQSLRGDFKLSPDNINIVNSANNLTEKADYVFICTKVMPNIDYKNNLSHVVNDNTVIVLIQNGLDIEDIFVKEFPNNHIISAVAYIGTQRIALGNYSHYGGEGKLIFGDFRLKNGLNKPNDEFISEQCYELEKVFNANNVTAEITNDIVKTRYEKLCWNASFNTISVMGNHATTKNIMDCSKSEQLAKNIMHEVEAISIADGHAISAGYIQKMLDFTRNFPEYKPSMLIDYECGRPLEIDAIVSNAIIKANELNVDVPLLKMTEALLKLFDRNNINK